MLFFFVMCRCPFDRFALWQLMKFADMTQSRGYQRGQELGASEGAVISFVSLLVGVSPFNF